MSEVKEMQIVLVPVDKIIPYWRNPRRNDKTVDALADIVLPKHGFNVPIVLDRNYVVVKGHARLRAAKKIGMKVVPCVFSDADPETIKADRIADNTIQEMSLWDMARLEVEWKKIERPEIEPLFHPENVSRLDVNFGRLEQPQPTAYQGTSLDDYGTDEDDSERPYRNPSYGSYEGSEGGNPNENPSEAPAFDSSLFRDEERESQGENGESVLGPSQAQMREPQTAKKALKTLCPYCGKTVYVRL